MIESGHVLILGWNQNIVEILNELIIANESEKEASIVILSAEEKEVMDDYLKEQIADRKTTSIITRTGEISSIHSLHKVSVKSAKSLIILPNASANSLKADKLSSDAKTLKSVLAILAACKKEEETPDIVAEVFQGSSEKVIRELAPGKITLVKPQELIAKITVQTSRTSGLASVYANLFGFDNCEFYFTSPDGKLIFGEAAYHYPDGVPIGIRKNDGRIVLRPSAETLLEPEDELILIAEDDSTIHFKKKVIIEPKEISYQSKTVNPDSEKALILGWNSKVKTIIEEFLDYMQPNSEITLVAEEKDNEIISIIDDLNTKNRDIKIEVQFASLLSIENLKAVGPQDYDSIIILSTIHDDQEVADAKSINILLLVRNLLKERIANNQVQLISEVLNADNLELISHAGVNDSIVSTKMVSKILAQVAEEPDILTVYEELFKEEGSEIYLKPLSYYTQDLPEKAQFADFIKLAQSRDEICIGFRAAKDEHNVSKDFGIIINPPKDKVFEPKSEDCLIVLAEDEN